MLLFCPTTHTFIAFSSYFPLRLSVLHHQSHSSHLPRHRLNAHPLHPTYLLLGITTRRFLDHGLRLLLLSLDWCTCPCLFDDLLGGVHFSFLNHTLIYTSITIDIYFFAWTRKESTIEKVSTMLWWQRERALCLAPQQLGFIITCLFAPFS